MKLVSVAEFRQSVPILDKDDITKYLFLAIDQVTLCLSSLLRTSFELKTVTDVYQLNPHADYMTDPICQFWLSNGFLTDSPVLLKLATTFDGLESVEAETTRVYVDKEKGIVSYAKPVSGYTLASVTYESGFISEEFPVIFSDETSLVELVAQNPPAWLASLATAYGFELYQALRELDNKIVKTQKGSGTAKTVFPPMSPGLQNQLKPHFRYCPTGVIPVMTL